MKPILILIVSIIALNVKGQESIHFESGNWSTIFEKAQEENKPIFLDAYASWCGPCKWMAANVFTDKAVADYMNRHFVNAKIDMETGEGPKLAERYSVSAYPTLLFLNSNGDVMHRICGARDAEAFITEATIAQDEGKRLTGIESNWKESFKDPTVTLGYLEALSAACLDYQEAQAQFLDVTPLTAYAQPEYFKVIYQFPPSLFSDAMLHVLDNRTEFEKSYGQKQIDTLVSKAVSIYLNDKRSEAFANEEPHVYLTARLKVSDLKLTGVNDVIYRSDLYFYERTERWDDFMNTAYAYFEGEGGATWDELNAVAWLIYEQISASKHLAYGEKWARQSIELNPNYYNYDTLAALLFKQGNKKEGLKMAKKAIELAKNEDEDYDGTIALIKEFLPDYKE